ncbi:uncharacterized protein LOC100908110 [Galendromus occidentalis]|uniref:Uncharacterized protein LOC100908110 n=1 Tax=Galendromus occidentalis TaxID=34638 RepID=A0AAJ7L6D2_9ACAR|nr:uncharacterized protein LOC100908110 [Galendromus occidentalis]
MAKQFKEGKEEEVEEFSPEGESSDDPTSDEHDHRTDGSPVKATNLGREPRPEFDVRAFLKLGFSVSALIVIVFILWGGSDQYYMNQFYLRRFSDDHVNHVEH